MKDDDVSRHLAENMRQLRETLGLTQQQLADRAGIPRATWSHLESGGGNPTLLVLVRVARGLGISVEELVGPPRTEVRFYRAADVPVRRRGGAIIRHLIPVPLAGLEVDRLELPPGARMAGVPHTAGTREYLTCERGSVELVASGQRFALAEGDVVAFRGDQKHSYNNAGERTAVAYSVVALAPTGG